jgi:hypothetical protein
MQENRMFTDEELKDMGQRTVDAITEAIDAGDLDQAKALAQRMHTECQGMHDSQVEWIAALLTFVGRNYGDEALHQALEEGCRAWVESMTEMAAHADVGGRAQMLAWAWRAHMLPISIEEDDEKFTFVIESCGSGGKLVLEGKYDPPRDFLKIKNAQPMSFGRRDFPVYCAHHLIEELVPQERLGYPLFITEPAENIGSEPCRMYLYKDPEAAPKR